MDLAKAFAPTPVTATANSLGEMIPTVYDELLRLAEIYLRGERSDHTLQRTALVHEAFLRLENQPTASWENRAHFLGIFSRTMRQTLTNYAIARNRQKRGGKDRLELAAEFYESRAIDVTRVDEALLEEAESLLEEAEILRRSANDDLEACAENAARRIRREVDSQVGKRIGAYVVTREIGRGGMGSVYLAARADGYFEKEVAIKLLNSGVDTEEMVRRFHSERQVLARLDHPNIARLLDAGVTDDGFQYFVMEYVEGVPVTRFLNESNASTASRLELFL